MATGDPGTAKERIRRWGGDLGLSAVGFAPAERPGSAGFLVEWLRRGYQATMGYLSRDPESRGDPEAILEGCRSVICVAQDYGGGEDPAADDPDRGRISRYAWGDDYHDVLGGKLRELARRIVEAWPGAGTRVAVDTSPVLERGFAARAGLGWVGKHTNLIDPVRGSWFFLGEIFTTLPLPPDRPIADHCGSCTRCIEVCPTGAIVEPYVLDARRCLSYWNIEHRGPIDPAVHEAMGNWIFGCDLCQDVCPWNGDAPALGEPRFVRRERVVGRPLAEWQGIDAEEFRDRFRGSAVKRARFDGFKRNVAVASGNARRERSSPMRRIEGEVRLYLAGWSPECRIARRFLERHSIPFQAIDVDRTPSAAEEAQAATGSRTVPVLRIGTRWIRVHDRARGFLYREAAEALGIPFDEIPELEARS